MTRYEILEQIEELENQLDEIDENEEELEQYRKDCRKDCRKFKNQMQILEEETGLSFEDLIKLVSAQNGGTDITINNNILEKEGN